MEQNSNTDIKQYLGQKEYPLKDADFLAIYGNERLLMQVAFKFMNRVILVKKSDRNLFTKGIVIYDHLIVFGIKDKTFYVKNARTIEREDTTGFVRENSIFVTLVKDREEVKRIEENKQINELKKQLDHARKGLIKLGVIKSKRENNPNYWQPTYAKKDDGWDMDFYKGAENKYYPKNIKPTIDKPYYKERKKYETD